VIHCLSIAQCTDLDVRHTAHTHTHIHTHKHAHTHTHTHTASILKLNYVLHPSFYANRTHTLSPWDPSKHIYKDGVSANEEGSSLLSFTISLTLWNMEGALKDKAAAQTLSKMHFEKGKNNLNNNWKKR